MGDGDSTATTLRWYRSEDSILDRNVDAEIGTNTVTNLGAGTSIAISKLITASNTPGSYYYFACVDGVADESNTDNNCSEALEVVVTAPELVVTLSASRTTVAPSETINLSTLITNAGDGDSTATTLRWYRSADNSLDRIADTEIGTSTVSSLGAGASITVSNTITASNTPGSYYYFACVDPVTNESNTDNNCSEASEVVVTAPELVVTLSASRTTVAPSETINLSTLISNTGDGDATAITLRWYLSADNILDTNTDTPLPTSTLSSLGAGASITIPSTTTASNTPGSYYYFACVDPVTDESDPDNNCSDAREVVVTVPDLVVTLNASRTTVARSATITLSALITNAGDGDATAITLRWYRSADNTLDTNTDTEIATNTLSSLGAGASIAVPNTITASNAFGSYYYFVCVDPVTDEVDTADNCSAALEVMVVSTPELTVTLSATSAVGSGSNVTALSAMVSNTGDGVSPATTLRWYRSADPSLETNADLLLGTGTVRSLATNTNELISISNAVPVNTNTYYYFACVDAVSNEADPANNCSAALGVAVPRGTRLPSLDFNNLFSVGNFSPDGIWSDGITMWVVNNPFSGTVKLFAYDLATKERNTNEDFDILTNAGNNNPYGIWSDGITMWVVQNPFSGTVKLYAYDLATKERNLNEDFDTLSNAGNNNPYGIWSDGDTMWVADVDDNKLYAYDLATKERNPNEDFDTLTNAGNDSPRGIWSDGITIWVADVGDAKLYAYKLSDKSRDPAKEFDTVGNIGPQGIWSDGITIWVVDPNNRKIFAYKK